MPNALGKTHQSEEDKKGSPPTGADDCRELKKHGGPNGENIYSDANGRSYCGICGGQMIA